MSFITSNYIRNKASPSIYHQQGYSGIFINNTPSVDLLPKNC